MCLVALLLAGCGSSTPPPDPTPAPKPPVSSGLTVERWFPLVDGHIYQYTTHDNEGAEGLLVTRASRSGATTGALLTGNGQKAFQYVADGVQLLAAHGNFYVLKQPIAVGTSWRGQHGGQVEITAVSTSVQVPAGNFSGCAVTKESRGGDVPLSVTTTYCPDVGIVLLEAQSGGRSERAALRSYGPPVNLGPDGVRRIP